MVIGNPPWAGIDIEASLEFAGLAGTTEFDKTITAAQGPVAAPRPIVELQDPHAVSGLAQFQRRRHAGKPGAKDQDGRALRIPLELDRTFVTGVGSEPERRHRMIHRRAAGNRSDQGQQVAPTDECRLAWHRCLWLNSYPAPERRYNDILCRASSAHRQSEVLSRSCDLEFAEAAPSPLTAKSGRGRSDPSPHLDLNSTALGVDDRDRPGPARGRAFDLDRKT